MEHLSFENLEQIKRNLQNFDDPLEMRSYLMKITRLDKYLDKRKIVKIGELPINCEIYEHEVNSPVIIFIPGIGTYTEMYAEFLSKLSEYGFNVVGVDLRGHGYSGGERGHYTVPQVQNDLTEVITYCIQNYNEKIALFGCSIGSPLALAVSENDNRVKALLCHTLFLAEYPLDFITMIGWNTLNITNFFMPNYKIDFRTFINVNELAKDNILADFMDYDDVLVWHYPVKTLSSIYSRKCKVIDTRFAFKSAILIGDRDELVKMDYINKIIKNMKHPFELLIIPNGRHMLPFDNINQTIISIKDWFKSVFD